MRYRLAVEFHRHAHGAEIHETGESILVALGGVAGAAGDDAAYPWYVYAGFLSVGAFVAAKVTEVATRALEESGGIVADGDD